MTFISSFNFLSQVKGYRILGLKLHRNHWKRIPDRFNLHYLYSIHEKISQSTDNYQSIIHCAFTVHWLYWFSTVSAQSVHSQCTVNAQTTWRSPYPRVHQKGACYSKNRESSEKCTDLNKVKWIQKRSKKRGNKDSQDSFFW